MFATCKIVIFWGGHFFCHFVDFLSFLVILSILSKILKSIKNYSKNHRKKGQNNDNVSRKMPFLQPAKLSFFVIFWHNFCQEYGNIFKK